MVVATGGLSYPSTGSTGDGYQWAREAGHKVTDLFPALVPFEAEELEDVKALQGLSLKNVEIAVHMGKRQLYREQGEMLFTHFGVSGPPDFKRQLLLCQGHPQVSPGFAHRFEAGFEYGTAGRQDSAGLFRSGEQAV